MVDRTTGKALNEASDNERHALEELQRDVRDVPRPVGAALVATLEPPTRVGRPSAAAVAPLRSHDVARGLKPGDPNWFLLPRRARGAARPATTTEQEPAATPAATEEHVPRSKKADGEPQERRGPGRPRKVVDEAAAAPTEKQRRKPGPKPRPAGADVKATKLRAGGSVLGLRLELSAVGGEDTRFRLWWELKGPKGKPERGCSGAWPTEKQGVEAYEAALKQARLDGWADMFISSGRGRPIELRPVPAPPGRA